MKVYVDELPKSCSECEFRNKKYGVCKINDTRLEYFGCHTLTSLADNNKQVKKKTIDDLAVSLISSFSKDAEFSVEEILNWLQEVKHQIQGE